MSVNPHSFQTLITALLFVLGLIAITFAFIDTSALMCALAAACWIIPLFLDGR